MRLGENPEKHLGSKNLIKNHRIIVVFYIPESNSDYYKELDLILDKCLESLTKTINFDSTSITLINNKSSPKINFIIDKYSQYIDKYVIYQENKGKVYALINELRSVFETFVTITDADILFYSGWESAVFNVFLKIPNAGAVSPIPLPYHCFHFNQSVFGINSIRNNIKFGKFVQDEDIDLYITGTNLPKLINRKTKYNWKQKQLILDVDGFKSVIGAYHVVTTFRKEQFRNVFTFPEMKFVNSYEDEFIDYLSDVNGLYRLSTINTFAYHIGNKVDTVMKNNIYDPSLIIDNKIFSSIKGFSKNPTFYIFLNRILGRFFIKFKWNK